MRKHGVTEFLNAFRDLGRKFYDLEPDYLITLDREGRIETVNPAFTRDTGYSENDVRHLPISELVLVEDWALFFQSISYFKDIDEGRLPRVPFRIFHKGDGTVRVVMILPHFEHIEQGGEGYLILRHVKSTGKSQADTP